MQQFAGFKWCLFRTANITATTLRIILFLLPVIIGGFDDASDYLYYTTNKFANEDLKTVCLVFLVLSPFVEFIAWFLLTTKLLKKAQKQKDEMHASTKREQVQSKQSGELTISIEEHADKSLNIKKS